MELPDSIPNSEVKRSSAENTWTFGPGTIGHCQDLLILNPLLNEWVFVFYVCKRQDSVSQYIHYTVLSCVEIKLSSKNQEKQKSYDKKLVKKGLVNNCSMSVTSALFLVGNFVNIRYEKTYSD